MHPYYRRDFGYHYPRIAYRNQPQVYPQYQAYPQAQVQYQTDSQAQGHNHFPQGYYYQPLYHCPTCGTPIYVVYVPTPQASNPPYTIAALLVAILLLLSVDIIFLRGK